MKKVRVDSYGKLLTNRAVAGPDRGGETKLGIISRYKFCLAFENSRSVDYVTEKFFHPLLAGTVPVYRGAPNVGDFAPGEKCFINADDFSGPAALAEYLNYLDGDAVAYREYFAWKSADFSSKFRAMIRTLSPDPLCRLCDVVAARTVPRREQDHGGERQYVRPLYFRRWHPRRMVQKARWARRAAIERLARSRKPDRR
jgi:alpha-1,3-fucosyltransferase 10